MNKLMGFLELRVLNIPTVAWKEFSNDTKLSRDRLWTVRSAKLSGNDLNMPRMVGKSADKCNEFAKYLKNRYGSLLFVVYYPYFVALKSGTLRVERERIVIKAVEKDLWNLEKEKRLDLSLVADKNKVSVLRGNIEFLDKKELEKLFDCAKKVFSYFNSKSIRYGESILLEWSFARDCDSVGNPIGEQYLVFYEARTDSLKHSIYF